MTQTTGGNAATAGRLVLLRHGQTVWSESGQHTGRTDIPLTAEGERQARDAGTRIQTAFPQGFGENCVYASPLKRAQQTASLAGFAPRTLPALAEWDYGRAEGRTCQTIAQLHGGSWELWNDGPDALSPTMEGDWTETLPDGEQVPVHNGPGESLSDVYDRVQQAIDQAVPLMESGHSVLFVAHAHAAHPYGTLAGVDPHFARLLRLDTAHYSILSVYKGDRVIERWNC